MSTKFYFICNHGIRRLICHLARKWIQPIVPLLEPTLGTATWTRFTTKYLNSLCPDKVWHVEHIQVVEPSHVMSATKDKHLSTEFSCGMSGTWWRHCALQYMHSMISASRHLTLWSVHLSTVGRRVFPVSTGNTQNDLPAHVTSAPSVMVFR